MTPPRSATPTPRAAAKIDWTAVHERLDRDATALRAAARATPEHARALLEERARLLARVPVTPPTAAEVIQVATFTLSAESYAIETCYVRRVVKLGEQTPVPGAPAILVGLINLSGEVLDVLDLRVLFGLPRAEPTALTRVVVLGADRDEFGVIADEANEVRTLRIDALHDPPAAVEGFGRQLLRGVTAEALIVLDGAALLGDDRLSINQGDDSSA